MIASSARSSLAETLPSSNLSGKVAILDFFLHAPWLHGENEESRDVQLSGIRSLEKKPLPQGIVELIIYSVEIFVDDAKEIFDAKDVRHWRRNREGRFHLVLALRLSRLEREVHQDDLFAKLMPE